jgi:FkbM family methyltransferase
MAEWGFIQVASRLIPGDVCVGFPNQMSLLVPPHMKGAAHFLAPTLSEFDEMSFVMHFLRPGDLFFDVGANIGAFTVLAAGVAGAAVTSFEPSPDTFKTLQKNVRLNQLDGRVKLFNAAVGRSEGEMQFTSGLGTENYVVTGDNLREPNHQTVTVKVVTLDQVSKQVVPRLLKIDVEGFETEVFAGAGQLIKSPELAGMIVERAGNAGRYGYGEADLHKNIRGNGFTPCLYEPFARKVTPVGDDVCGNLIYLRDFEAANLILKAAPPYKFGQLSV